VGTGHHRPHDPGRALAACALYGTIMIFRLLTICVLLQGCQCLLLPTGFCFTFDPHPIFLPGLRSHRTVGLAPARNLRTLSMNLSKNNPTSTNDRARFSYRKSHNLVSPIVALPLLISALSATIWVICRRWLGMSKESTKFLLQIHQGDGIVPS
jgi:hypothetical protein